VNADAAFKSGALVSRRNAVLNKPGKVIAHAGLPGLITVKAGMMPSSHNRTCPATTLLFGAQHHVAVGGAHDDDHAARLGDGRSGHSHVGIHIGNRHGSAGFEARPGGGFFRQSARFGAQVRSIARHFLVDHILKARVEFFQECFIGETFRLDQMAL
jgi:hypothetical protein